MSLIAPFDTICNKTSLLNSFFSLRLGFQKTIYDASKDIVVVKGDKDSSALRGESHINFPTQRVIMAQTL